MKKPIAMLIDLDDTLICFDGVSKAAWRQACESYSADNPHVDSVSLAEEISGYAHWYYSDPERHKRGRNQLEETRRHIVKEAFRIIGIDDPDGAAAVGDLYSRVRTDMLYLFPGVHETLAALRERRIRLCLITNGESHLQREKIERFHLAEFFDVILIEGELGFGKPDERVYFQAVEQLGVRLEDAWIVGDNFEWEVVAPKRLGFTCVWHDWRKSGVPVGELHPDAIIVDIRDLIALVDGQAETA